MGEHRYSYVVCCSSIRSAALIRLARPAGAFACAATVSYARCETPEELMREADKKSLRQAHLLYKKAAEHGDVEATYRLAQNYLKGVGTTKDPIRAAELFQVAADKGHVESTYALAVLYRLGKGVPRDLKKSVALAKKAAEMGCMEAAGAMTASNLNADAKADFGRGRLQQSRA